MEKESKFSGGNPYENLAAAIVVQAAKDYSTALKDIKKNRENIKAMKIAMEVERFLRSGWYAELSDIDSEYMIRKLREEVVS